MKDFKDVATAHKDLLKQQLAHLEKEVKAVNLLSNNSYATVDVIITLLTSHGINVQAFKQTLGEDGETIGLVGLRYMSIEAIYKYNYRTKKLSRYGNLNLYLDSNIVINDYIY